MTIEHRVKVSCGRAIVWLSAYLASCCSYGVAEEPVEIGIHTGGVKCLAIFSKDAVVASGGSDGAVRMWDLKERHLTKTIQASVGAVKSLAVSSDAGRLALAGRFVDGMQFGFIQVRDLRTDAVCWADKSNGQYGRVDQIVFGPEGNWLVTANIDQPMTIRNARTGNVIRELVRNLEGFSGLEKALVRGRHGTYALAVAPDFRPDHAWSDYA